MNRLIVFDMDGVIVDVSLSYRDTVRKSVYLFFKDCRGGGTLPNPLFELADLAFVKQGGGLNNDWDLTYRIITLMMSRVAAGEADDETAVESSAAAETPGRSSWDVSKLAEYLANTEKPLEKLYREIKGCYSAEAEYYYKGDVGSGNIIKQIFQEVYLGPDIFKTSYGFNPQYYKEEGFIHREKLLITREMLLKLSSAGILAIATGRPGGEAVYPLEKNRLDFFSEIVSLDDCLKAEAQEEAASGRKISFSKPHPYMLDRIAEKYPGCSAYYYIGDMPDDMLTAKNAEKNFTAVGVVFSSPDRALTEKRLINAGADAVAETPEELLKIIINN